MRYRIRFPSPLAIFLAAVVAAPVFAASQKPIEKFEAFAAALGTGRSAVVEIGIDRWSTDEERERLLTALQEFGPDRLVDELEKIRPPVGYIRTTSSIAYDLYYARNHVNPDGSRSIVLATNRRVSFREAVSSSRSLQYQATVLELHVGANGKGEGKLVPAAKITWNRDVHRIEIENYDTLPVDLLDVHPARP